MRKVIFYGFLWVGSFFWFYLSIIYWKQQTEDISYEFLKDIAEFENYYQIEFEIDQDIEWYFWEEFSESSDWFTYDFNINYDLPESVNTEILHIIDNINWTINFYNNTKIDNFFINIWNDSQISGQTAVGGEERILIEFTQNNEEIFSDVFDTSKINLDLLFTRFLPYMDFNDNKTKKITTFSPIWFNSKNNLEEDITIEKINKEKYTVSSWFMWMEYETKIHFDDKTMTKQQNPFFTYQKVDQKELEKQEIDQNLHTQENSNKEENTTDTDEESNNNKENNLECKLIWND